MHDMSFMLLLVVFLALVFDFINGFHDTANAIATTVSTRAISPKTAIMMSAVLNFFGALLSTGVAKTIGGDIVKSASMVNANVIVAALIAAIIWNLVTWWYGIPSSSSHALIGGLVGAVAAASGFEALNAKGIETIVLSLVISPVIALVTGYIIMILLLWVFGRLAPNALNHGFKKMQLISAAAMAFSHGSNDAQKAMGIITLALVSGGMIDSFEVPTWVKFACAASMALGTAAGGKKIIKTMGTNIFRMVPMSGFSADLGSAIVISLATFFHLPVSTTHVVSGSIMGVGSAKRVTAVRWTVAQNMLMAWVLTIPLSAAVGVLIYKATLFF
ncbi:MAG: inorganic phosphate transporter [Acholeplasmataceae bacterium]|nr:inorganic phosphate transporter [Acholeplasmataceae bacterium]